MKPHCKHLATALAATLQLAAIAAVPLAWDVRPGQPAPVTFDRYHGETLSFSATFRSFGELPFAPGADIRLWYQTNGMGSAWWSVPATIQSNVLSATWSPALDPGADRVSLFFGAPSNAYAAAVLRLRHSPGFAPGSMPDPESFHESDPVFAAWLATYTPPDTSLEPATNYTDRALSSFAATGTVARALTYGTATRWTDATGCVWEASMSWKITPPTFPGADGYPEEYVGEPIYFYEDHSPGAWWSPRVGDDWLLGLGKGYSNSTELAWAVDVEAAIAITATRGLVTNLIGRIALTNDIGGSIREAVAKTARAATNYTDALETRLALGDKKVMSAKYADSAYDSMHLYDEDHSVKYNASDLIKASTNAAEAVAAPLQRDISDIRTESALVYRLYSGSNVVAEVTNYNSQVHAPSLRLLQLNESNEYVTVWTETDGLARTLREATNYTDRAIADYAAPRAWSRTTSGLGAETPDGETWITTPKVYVTGGLEYHQTVDTYGAVWVLCSNGMTPEYSPDTNAYFRISADDGTPIFSIEKSDAMVVGANAAGITVGESSVTIPVPVVSTDPPTMYWRQSLSSGDWADESSPPAGATVTWTGEAGARVCTVTWSGTRPSSMFFKFTFLQEGGVVIRNNATTDISSGIYVNGVKFVPTVSGNNLIWTKQ